METNLNLFIILGAAVIDSINPCAIGVLVFLLAYLTQMKVSSRALLFHGLLYLAAVFFTYLIVGALLLPVIQQMRSFSVMSYLAIAAIIGVFGLLELKEFFLPGKTSLIGIAPRYSLMIKKQAQKMSNNPFVTFGLGIFVALVELPCTGAVYLAVLSLMALSGLNISNLAMLVIYNIIFILPLVVILILFCRGTSAEVIQRWQEKNKAKMHLSVGLLLLGLAAWMVAFTVL
jgi:cytochrome c biogenesis protein CcdA